MGASPATQVSHVSRREIIAQTGRLQLDEATGEPQPCGHGGVYPQASRLEKDRTVEKQKQRQAERLTERQREAGGQAGWQAGRPEISRHGKRLDDGPKIITSQS